MKSALKISIIASSLLLAGQLSASKDDSRLLAKPQTDSNTSSSVKLGSSTCETSQSVTISPSKTGVRSSIAVEELGRYRLDIGAIYESANVKNDILLSASYRLLYAGAKMGTYISIQKGSELEKFVLSQGFALERGRIKLSVALLKRLTRFDFSEYSKSFDEKVAQKAYGVQYSYTFGADSLLEELKSSVVYYDIDGKELGHIGDIIINNATLYDWTMVKGGYRGASKLIAEAAASFRLFESVKLTTSLGYDGIRYKSMYQDAAESSSKLAMSAFLKYRINDYNMLELSNENRNTINSSGAKYTHNFGNAMEAFVSATRLKRDVGEDDTQYRFGLQYSFGHEGRHTRLSPLFASSYANREKLSLSELSPIALVDADNLALIPKTAISKEHIASVDKSALAAGDGIALANDGTLEAIYWDNGGYPVSSVLSVSDSGYTQFVVVRESKLAIMNILALNSYMASQGMASGAAKVSVYQIAIVKGSAQFNSSKKSVKGVGSAVAQAFVQNTLDSRIANDFINGTLSATIINKILDGTITGEHIAAYKAGTLSISNLQNIKSLSELLADKSAMLSQLPSTILTGAAIPSVQQAAYEAAKTALQNANTQDAIASALTAYNTALASLNTAITTANTAYETEQVRIRAEQAAAAAAQAAAEQAAAAAAAAAATDTTPNAFSFTDQTGIALSTLTESAAITVAGTNAASAISVTGGEYQIDGGAWTSTAGTVTNGQSVKVRHTSSASNSTATNTTLTIGGVSDTFSTTTVAAASDTTPDAFTFVDQTNLHLSTLTESAAITVAGIDAAAAISVTGGEYQINGGSWTSGAGTVTNGQSVKVRNTTGSLGNTAVNTALTIGGVSDTFTTTTTTTIYKVGNIVTDPSTGLQWQDDAAAGTHFENWANAQTYCSALTIDGVSGWRLPTLTELQGIVDTGNHPTIKTGFTNAATSYYWSSTEVDATLAWVVNFYDGDSGWDAKTLSHFVRCVR